MIWKKILETGAHMEQKEVIEHGIPIISNWMPWVLVHFEITPIDMLKRSWYAVFMAEKKPTKKKKDLNELAFDIVQQATRQIQPEETPSDKNPSAVALGRLGGLKGGPARAKKLSKKKRSEIARKAAIARWSKKSD